MQQADVLIHLPASLFVGTHLFLQLVPSDVCVVFSVGSVRCSTQEWFPCNVCHTTTELFDATPYFIYIALHSAYTGTSFVYAHVLLDYAGAIPKCWLRRRHKGTSSL